MVRELKHIETMAGGVILLCTYSRKTVKGISWGSKV